MQQVSNLGLKYFQLIYKKIRKNDYNLPKKLLVRHENMSGNYKTMSGARSELYQETAWTHVLEGT